MKEPNQDGTAPGKRAPAAAKKAVARSGTKSTGATKTTSAIKKAAKTTAATTRSAGAGKALGGVRRSAAPARITTVGKSISWQPDVRASQVVKVLGNRRAAALLGVAESQPSRWRKALEVPSPQIAPMLVDLDHIIARLQLIWDEEVIGDWLEGTNAFLDGARPIDVLRVNGSVPVLEAIEAEAAGAYA